MKNNLIGILLFFNCYFLSAQNDSLIVYFTFSNDSAEDISGNENHGIVSGAAFIADSGFFKFDGLDDFINTNSVLNDVMGDSIGTWSCWINPDSVTYGQQTIIEFGDSTTWRAMRLAIINGLLSLDVDNEQHIITVTSQDTVLTNHSWHHIALVQDGKMPKIYLNGSPFSLNKNVITDSTYWYKSFAGDLNYGRIGKSSYNDYERFHFLGGIDEVQIFDLALDSVAINKIYSKTEDNENNITNLYNNSINIYPNPTNNILWVSFEYDKPNNIIVRLIDISGNIKWSEKINQNKYGINVNSYPEGLYILQLLDKNNSVIDTKKVLIH